jgi:hypothetical protein
MDTTVIESVTPYRVCYTSLPSGREIYLVCNGCNSDTFFSDLKEEDRCASCGYASDFDTDCAYIPLIKIII